ncbi:MAG: hypothetical protein IOC52_10475 [Methylobacterium sp.]|nr:hypothetical protein [Methylobacterium sp.]
MSAYSPSRLDKLFDLLPAYLRELDGPERLRPEDPPGPLQALLRVIEAQADALDADLVQLGNDAFIETCEPWVIPYIGDLVGTTPLFDASRIRDGDTAAELFTNLNGPDFTPGIGLGNRADVARTICYRRRKGTLPLLEELARDITGWPCHAVEFFERLIWSQWLRDHQRPQALHTPDLRAVEPLDRLGGPFESACHTPDLRPIAPDEGWYGIRKIGLFLWRLLAQRLEALDARRQGGAGDFRWRFSPLGQDAPLFSARRREDDDGGLSERHHVPQAISHATFFADLSVVLAQPVVPDFSEFYGLFDPFPGLIRAEGRAMMIFIDGAPVPLARIRCANLSTWRQPTGNLVAIDVATGRIALGPLAAAGAGQVSVSCHAGFPGNLGGGPYRRRAWLTRRIAGTQELPVDASGAPGTFTTLNAALAQWAALGKPDCCIVIRDNRTYAEALAIEPADGRFLAIEAADGFRPHLRLTGPLAISGEHDNAAVTLGGLLVEGTLAVQGSLERLRLIHCTLVPGGSIAVPDPAAPPAPPAPVPASITVAATRADGSPANTDLVIEAAFSLLGPLRLPARMKRLVLLDSVVDGRGQPAICGPAMPAAGPALRIERSTLRGAVLARQIDLASDSLFDGPLSVERQQVGCIRFSFVRPSSVTPRRYRCQPDLAIRRALEAAGPIAPAEADALRAALSARIQPEYTEEAYGQPAYLQLSDNAPPELFTGAEDGAEMGVWCHLKQPQRLANLQLRLEEYLPFGLEAGAIPVT